MFFIGFFSAASYLKSTYYDPIYVEPKLVQKRKEDQEIDRKARDFLYYNKVGAPTRPTRSMDDFLTFMNSNEALEKNFEYLMFGLDINSDQLNGLDSYTT